ncbi:MULTISPECIES: holo-ACP synthase [Ramlibacter]|uniref:Holo-[acyl-carrier-protein] synthase n=1 Tax=Ramlibacter aquaticus TaxID=2780094 RepID=A0ABR9SG63_9BURK|nr:MULTISPECIES: holo-ACP synthase [Ramlibacter]MBE7941340.1 holo-ACP synthase [Ramlibacter aquaticus]
METGIPPAPGIRVGFDLAQVSGIAGSLRSFGQRFADRLFTADEQAYALSGQGQFAQRLAARFAAKEAVIKALSLSEAGIDWRDIEVRRLPDGDCRVVLHGRVQQLADAQGVQGISLSMSHEGDIAGAFVTVTSRSIQTP